MIAKVTDHAISHVALSARLRRLPPKDRDLSQYSSIRSSYVPRLPALIRSWTGCFGPGINAVI